MVRIIFIDERGKIAGGLPAAQANAGEQIMTRANSSQLVELVQKMLKDNPA